MLFKHSQIVNHKRTILGRLTRLKETAVKRKDSLQQITFYYTVL